MSLSTCTLRDGAEVPEILASVTMISLDQLLHDNPIAFYELVMSARDRSHVIFGAAGEQLNALSLIDHVNEDGTAEMHGSIRDIVVSAVEGEEFHDLIFASPIARSGVPE